MEIEKIREEDMDWDTHEKRVAEAEDSERDVMAGWIPGNFIFDDEVEEFED